MTDRIPRLTDLVREGIMSFAMSVEEREQFLAGLHVGVLSVAVKGDGEAVGGDGGRSPSRSGTTTSPAAR